MLPLILIQVLLFTISCSHGTQSIAASPAIVVPVVPPSPSEDQFALWDKIDRPVAGEADSIGGYAAGCILGAQALPLEGSGYVVMHPERHRFFGHPKLIDYLKNLAAKLKKAKLGTLLVGDMGHPRGGPMLSGHASHQIGLDVDLWYLVPKRAPSVPERQTISAGHYAANGKIAKNWTKFQVQVVKDAADDERVDRIFVNPAIKKALCNSEKKASWLRKLRPWWGHDDHFHVRLACPKEAVHCTPVASLPEGSGCDKSLNWWFSADAKKALEDRGAKPREFPKLPTACAVLTDGFSTTIHSSN